MTGLQKRAYKFQTGALITLCFAFIAFILTWWSLGMWLLIFALACLVKAMMYRERWEMEAQYDAWAIFLKENEQE